MDSKKFLSASLLIALLLFTISLGGCGYKSRYEFCVEDRSILQQQVRDLKEDSRYYKDKIKELESEVDNKNKNNDDDIFSKNEQCQKYKSKYEETLNYVTAFYSPLKKSCIIEVQYFDDGPPPHVKSHLIVDPISTKAYYYSSDGKETLWDKEFNGMQPSNIIEALQSK